MKKHNHTPTKQNGILFIMAALLLIASLACGLADQIIATPTSTPTSTTVPTETILPSPIPSETATVLSPPTIQYSEDFSDPYSGWLKGAQPDNPKFNFDYQDGEYVIKMAKGIDTVSWVFAQRNFSDSVISVDVRHISGDPNLTGPVIFWRVSKDFKSYYWLFVYASGQFSIQKVSNGVNSIIRDWGIEPAINRGQKVNHIDIASVGDLNTIYINGIQVASFNDSSSLQGDIALGATSTKKSEIEVAYDNLIVYSSRNWVPTQNK